jgi:Sulfotransferase domain/N-terminal domain of galactosyltransferase
VSAANPRIAFCTTLKNRTIHLKLTLPRNLRENADYPNAVFVIVNYGTEDDLLDYLHVHHLADIASGRIVVYSYANSGPFKIAHAKSMAHRCGMMEGATLLVNLDADNYACPGFASYLAKEYATHGPECFWWGRMIPGVLDRGVNGRIACTAQQFINVGGYDNKYADWSRDDKDFNERLCKQGYIPKEIDQRFLQCEKHNDKVRFKDYKHVKKNYDSGDLPDMNDSEVTVVNFGAIGCGTVTRNFDPDPIELKILPTRVFGIGLHKTGTTSLHHAFEILGFNSWHWSSAHYAKKIWAEMKAFGKSTALEHYYAACDLPLAMLYKELDRAYPNSRFILTLRDENDWLRSVENHWARATNKWRNAWDTDPFTHFIHKEIYGQKNFDRELFRARYRRHNAEVMNYFARRNDLLVLDVDEAHKWSKLCTFLDRPLPGVPYPSNNLTNGV